MIKLALSCALAALAALCFGGEPVHAQVAPLRYWIPGGPFGLSGGAGQSSDTYGNFANFNAVDADWRTSSASGFFVGGERGNLGLSGFSQAGPVGNFSALSYDSTQFGYSVKTAAGMPVTFFAGFNTLNYGNGIGSSLAPLTSIATPGYGGFAGVEFKPTSNLSLSFGVGYTQQQSGRTDSDINSSMLPGESPALGGLRR
ncbi:hypothetical protein [Bradyrhizobium sp. CCBAU 53415]|uniref:hypothetical protein n=1 Tax=Bradyrhizobium sp. CCBAU 53415 TaxID=1325119 RepID=UPI002305F675|nr:hypothetical protein [Bradyrhizobium sp. CCBAU 53415]MDA9463495.1 hypothetical protein [Bradyrhizobium sp. CCBAU 53415]